MSLAGLNIPSILKDLRRFVGDFDFSIASQLFLEKPTKASQTAHVHTLSAQSIAHAIQVHGTNLLHQAQQAVMGLVSALVSEVSQILSQQHVATVLEAAKAAVRAQAEAGWQTPSALPFDSASLTGAPSEMRQDGTSKSQFPDSAEATGSYNDGKGLQASWLQTLSASQLVEHAEMLQAALQQQQGTEELTSCIRQINELLTGSASRFALVAWSLMPCCDVPLHLWLSEPCVM